MVCSVTPSPDLTSSSPPTRCHPPEVRPWPGPPQMQTQLVTLSGTALVGYAVGHECQPEAVGSGSLRSRKEYPDPRESPATARKAAPDEDAGGGTRTPDTRIMIPLL